MRSLALFSAATAVASALPVGLWSSRQFTAEDSSRLASTDGVFAALRSASQRSPSAHISIALVSSDELQQGQAACSSGSFLAAQYPEVGDGEVGPLAAAEAQLASVCNVYWVGSYPEEAGVKTLTTAEYQASLTSQVQGCTVYLLSQLPGSLPCKAVGEEGEAGRLTAMALVSWPGRSRGLGAAAAATAAAAPLAGGGRGAGTAALGINMGPQILEGLIVGALLLVITLVGISCITTVATPDVLHSESMPAGKEY